MNWVPSAGIVNLASMLLLTLDCAAFEIWAAILNEEQHPHLRMERIDNVGPS